MNKWQCLSILQTVLITSLIFTTRFNVEKSYVFPHSLLVYFGRISDRTAIISSFIINRLVFRTESKPVYSAVWTVFLHIAFVNFQYFSLKICHLKCPSADSRSHFSVTRINKWDPGPVSDKGVTLISLSYTSTVSLFPKTLSFGVSTSSFGVWTSSPASWAFRG